MKVLSEDYVGNWLVSRDFELLRVSGVFGFPPPFIKILVDVWANSLRSGPLSEWHELEMHVSLLLVSWNTLEHCCRSCSKLVESCSSHFCMKVILCPSLPLQYCKGRKNNLRIQNPLLSRHLKKWKCTWLFHHRSLLHICGGKRETFSSNYFLVTVGRVFCAGSHRRIKPRLL